MNKENPFAKLDKLLHHRQCKTTEGGADERRDASPAPPSPFNAFAVALPGENTSHAQQKTPDPVTIASKIEVEPSWPPPLRAAEMTKDPSQPNCKEPSDPLPVPPHDQRRHTRTTSDTVGMKKGGAPRALEENDVFTSRTEPMPITMQLSSDWDVKLQGRAQPTKSCGIDLGSSRKESLGAHGSAGSAALQQQFPMVPSHSSDGSVKIRRGPLPQNAFSPPSAFGDPMPDLSRKGDEKVEVPEDAVVVSLGQMGSETFPSERSDPLLPKLDRLPLPRKASFGSHPSEIPQTPKSEDDPASPAPWLEGQDLPKMPKISKLSEQQLGKRAPSDPFSKEGDTLHGRGAGIDMRLRSHQSAHGGEEPNHFLDMAASSASKDGEISRPGAEGAGLLQLPRFGGRKGREADVNAEDRASRGFGSRASGFLARLHELNRRRLLPERGAKPGQDPVVQPRGCLPQNPFAPEYCADNSSRSARFNVQEVVGILNASALADACPPNASKLPSGSSEQSTSEDCDKHHLILTAEDTLAIMEHLTSGEAEVLLQPGSYVRPLGSNTAAVECRAPGHVLDPHNMKLLKNVTIAGPDAKLSTQLVVIGAGAGGLATAVAASEMGLEVTLVEEGCLGGSRLNYSCVPHNAVLQCVRAADQARRAKVFGVKSLRIADIKPDFHAALERMRGMRAVLSKSSSVQMLADRGIKSINGRACFTGPDTLMVQGRRLTFGKAVIATGASQAVPNIPGLKECPYLTTVSCWNLDKLPESLAVLGASHAAVEVAQAFARFGSKVTIFARSRLLAKEDPEAVEVVREQLRADGVEVLTDCSVETVLHDKMHGYNITCSWGGGDATSKLNFDALLVAAGKLPNVTGLGLAAAGIRYHPQHGIMVGDNLETSVSNIFAVGDVCTAFRFTHTADTMAKMVVGQITSHNTRTQKVSRLVIPWFLSCDPQLAHVGLYEADLTAQGIPFQTLRLDFADVDAAVLQGDTRGFVKLLVAAESGAILGASIVGFEADGMISQVAIAMQAGMGVRQLAAVVYPYPSKAEALRMCCKKFFSGQQKVSGTSLVQGSGLR